MSDKNGGPAFPSMKQLTEDDIHNDYHMSGPDGMSLRDYFAAKALQAMLSQPNRGGRPDYYASDAYRYADAMLKAREDKRS